MKRKHELEGIIDPDVLEWSRLTPAQRLDRSFELLQHYLAMGGSLDPEPDADSPFYVRPEPDEKQAKTRRRTKRVFKPKRTPRRRRGG